MVNFYLVICVDGGSDWVERHNEGKITIAEVVHYFFPLPLSCVMFPGAVDKARNGDIVFFFIFKSSQMMRPCRSIIMSHQVYPVRSCCIKIIFLPFLILPKLRHVKIKSTWVIILTDSSRVTPFRSDFQSYYWHRLKCKNNKKIMPKSDSGIVKSAQFTHRFLAPGNQRLEKKLGSQATFSHI